MAAMTTNQKTAKMVLQRRAGIPRLAAEACRECKHIPQKGVFFDKRRKVTSQTRGQGENDGEEQAVGAVNAADADACVAGSRIGRSQGRTNP